MKNFYFDLVICVGPNDNDILEHMLVFNKKNIIGYRNIYLVCSNPRINIEGTITIDEKMYPFQMSDLIKKFDKNTRNGWYLQQLLKFYAGSVIPDILPNYLIVDCDTHFLRPVKFITDEGKYIYTTGTEYHKQYFHHMNRLDASLKKSHPLSGISHHTLFNTEIVNELMKRIEGNFNNKKAFWELYLEAIDLKEYNESGAAENELYFTYMFLYHKDKMIIRQLNWVNVSSYKSSYSKKFDFVSIHWYKRRTLKNLLRIIKSSFSK